MAYTLDDLKNKITEMYPEISKHSISIGLELDKEKDSYIVKLKKENLNTQHIWTKKMLINV